MPVPTTIKFWVNAFIPGHVAGVTFRLPNNRGSVVLDPASGGTAYATNNRAFSSDINALSKMHSEIVLERVAGRWRAGNQWTNSDPVVRYAWPSGTPGETRRADTRRCSWRSGSAVAHPVAGIAFGGTPGRQGLAFHCLISNPHLPAGSFGYYVGAVDADLSFEVDEAAGRVTVAGVVDDFPAYEIYAAFNNGPPVTLLRLSPRPGMSPVNLVGPAEVRVRAEAAW